MKILFFILLLVWNSTFPPFDIARASTYTCKRHIKVMTLKHQHSNEKETGEQNEHFGSLACNIFRRSCNNGWLGVEPQIHRRPGKALRFDYFGWYMMHCVWLRQITYILIMKIKHWSGTGDHIGSDMRRWRKIKPLGWDGGSVALITHHPIWCSIHITQHPTNLISHMISHGEGYFRAETIITFPRWEDLCGNSAYSGRR